MTRKRPPAHRRARRAAVVVVTTIRHLAPALPAVGWRASRRNGADPIGPLTDRVVVLAERLGPAYVKVGQVLATRRDVLPLALCDALSTLADEATPLRRGEAERALSEAYGPNWRGVLTIEDQAVASGSVASVYRGRLADGREVAVKVQRPDITEIIELDLAIIGDLGVAVSWLPLFRGSPVREIIANLCRAIEDQLDFLQEAAGLGRLRRNLALVPRVWVPSPLVELSRERVIVMDFIPGLDPSVAARANLQARRRFAETTLQAVYWMLFVDGFVHCDLHRGNLYLLPTGHIVVLDAGFNHQLSDRMRRLFGTFFMNMSLGNGPTCGRIVVESAVGMRDDAEVESFVEHMAALVHRTHALPAREFSLLGFASEMFALQRRFGLFAAPEIVFPLLSLLVIEGTIRELNPDIDFQDVAEPILKRALFTTSSTPW